MLIEGTPRCRFGFAAMGYAPDISDRPRQSSLAATVLCLIASIAGGPLDAMRIADGASGAGGHVVRIDAVRLAQSGDAADVVYPIQRNQRPRFIVGDTMPEDLADRLYYPGLDLPQLKGTETYVRTNEFIYRIDRETRRIQEVIPIAAVILR